MEVTPVELRKSFFEHLYPEIKFDENGICKVYSNVDDEYKALKRGVALRDLSNNCIIKLVGSETKDFINRISSNKVDNLENYQFNETLFLNDKGRIIDKATFIKFNENHLVVGSYAPKLKLKRWIDNYIIMEDIKTEMVTENFFLLECLGPQAESYLTVLLGSEIERLKENEVKKFLGDGFSYYILKKQENKFWLILEQQSPKDFVTYLDSCKSVFDFSFVGSEAYNIYRIENMIPEYPSEINLSYNPYDIGLMNYVSLNKGCFIGQEVIARIDTYEKQQKEMKLVKILDENLTVELPFEFKDKMDQTIASLTSVVFSKKYDSYIGLCIAKTKKEELNKVIEGKVEFIK